MTQLLQDLDAPATPARRTPTRRTPVLRAVTAAALAASVLFASVGPSVAMSDGDSVRGPSRALCRFFPIYCNPR